MAYKLVYYPDPLLKTISEPIKEFNFEELKTLSEDMIEAMLENNGMGLSAIQIGRPLRFMVLKSVGQEKILYIGMANPMVVKHMGNELVGNEGCLSFPGIRTDVNRPEHIDVKWHNLQGTEYITTFYGIEARCIQHEIDHMDGITFIDKLPDYRRIKIQSKLTAMKRAYKAIEK